MSREFTNLCIPLDRIIVEDRARKTITQESIEELAQGIERHTTGSLLHPIVVEPHGDNFRLVAGERRLRAFQHLARHQPDLYGTIPARLTADLVLSERKILELEENIKREDLFWQDEAESILQYYELRCTQEALDNEEYTFAMMSGELQRSDTVCMRTVTVAKALRTKDKRVLACDSIRSASAVIQRDVGRAIENEVLTFGEIEHTIAAPLHVEDPLDLEIDLNLTTLQQHSVLQQDFIEFAESYSGPPFNFIHCDFPFEIGLDASAQYKTERFVSYDDSSKDIYAVLIRSLGVARRRGVLSASAHCLFWFPMSKYVETEEWLQQEGFKVNSYPLVWVKSDKVGIVPDAARYPRRIYETAFLCSLGDRKIIKPLFNASVQPSQKHDAAHASYKPHSVLREWLPMFIDSDSIVLDPTCGSGSALAVALELGAKLVVGLDIGEESVSLSLQACKAALVRKGP